MELIVNKDNASSNIERVHVSEITYEDFYENYMKKNIPLILTGYIDKHWTSYKSFCNNNSNNNNIGHTSNMNMEINIEYLINKFRDAKVPVYEHSSIDIESRVYGNATNITMTFQEYIENYYYYDKNTTAVTKASLSSLTSKKKEERANINNSLFYLKDWHYNIACMEANVDSEYSIPVYFQSDWLNEWWEMHRREFFFNFENPKHQQYIKYIYNVENDIDKESDFKFLYFGNANTFTPLHHDIFKSYSWSGQIVGQKKWYLYPPHNEKYFDDDPPCGNYKLLSSEKHKLKYGPKLKYVTGMIEVVQEPGELIFVPSGWYHEVYNQTSSISINHNWLNECNIEMVYQHLKEEWKQTVNAIIDIKDIMAEKKDFILECNKLMHRNTGMSLYEFRFFILFYIEKYKKNVSSSIAALELLTKIVADVNLELIDIV